LPAALVNNYANGIASEHFFALQCPTFSSPLGDKLPVKLFDRVLNPREIRRRLGLNQEQFWTQIGVTQSGGSRYESGRDMPKPVRELLRLVHVEQIDLSQVKRVDFEIISYLKESHPDLYRSLRRAVRSKHKRPDGEPAALTDDAGMSAEAEEAEDADDANEASADDITGPDLATSTPR
jgi:transcriptional regulator with XRE-family HTH domain